MAGFQQVLLNPGRAGGLGPAGSDRLSLFREKHDLFAVRTDYYFERRFVYKAKIAFLFRNRVKMVGNCSFTVGPGTPFLTVSEQSFQLGHTTPSPGNRPAKYHIMNVKGVLGARCDAYPSMRRKGESQLKVNDV
ncbi:MAG: hypothetical protein A2270_00770 [Elusimicrobia bacterium RIFOXYA12_FULL_51_18]|nr:MAG: hypothetical protein A2270_00770 [Elusimicrobia bacterium RIFOXYA12_FULL_51_18]OGS29030.1 MAG: hypothetical protein A2218_08785 [Elusimicrobia bacterium RIFOXYA2_FULL_53_38]